MSVLFHYRWRLSIGTVLTLLALILALVFALSSRAFTFAAVPIVQISSDPYTNSTSQHQTEVEPDSFSFGSTIVSVTQAGRFTNGGSSNIGWATSSNNGTSWTNGFLPGTTVFATPAGPYDRISDPSVAFDAHHNTWLTASLALLSTNGAAVLVNRSTNITGPMTLSWLANTTQGRMVGDYISTSFNSSGMAFPFFAVATAPTGGNSCGKGHATCHEALYTLGSGVTIQSGNHSSHGDSVVYTAQPTAPSRHTSR